MTIKYSMLDITAFCLNDQNKEIHKEIEKSGIGIQLVLFGTIKPLICVIHYQGSV